MNINIFIYIYIYRYRYKVDYKRQVGDYACAEQDVGLSDLDLRRAYPSTALSGSCTVTASWGSMARAVASNGGVVLRNRQPFDVSNVGRLCHVATPALH